MNPRLINGQDNLFAVGVGSVGVGSGCKTADDRVSVRVRITHIESLMVHVGRRKRDILKPLLQPFSPNPLRNIEERRFDKHSVSDDADAPFFFEHKQAAAAIPSVC